MGAERDTCFRCKHILLEHSHGAYSDVTPGEDFSLGCTKEYFFLDGHSSTGRDWATNIVRSVDCTGFEAGRIGHGS